jgi:hypothetical protein
LIRKREEMYQIFRKKYIIDDHGQLRTGIAIKKMENGNEYIGQFDIAGKKTGKGILHCKNGDKYFGDWKSNNFDG